MAKKNTKRRLKEKHIIIVRESNKQKRVTIPKESKIKKGDYVEVSEL